MSLNDIKIVRIKNKITFKFIKIIKKNPVKEFIFSKVADLQPASLLKINLFTVFSKVLGNIKEHL